MSRLINYLQSNIRLNIFVLLVYYLLVVLPHEKVGITIAGIFENQSRENYNLIVLIIALVLFVTVFSFVIRKVISHPQKKFLILYFSITLLFVVLCFNILFVVNVEFIHFVQYAVFAILCYPLINNYLQSLIFATIAGAFDEAYQYFYLSPHRTDYYDWNDVIINLIGAAIGILIVKTFVLNQVKPTTKFFKSPIFYFLCAVVLSVIALLGIGVLTVYPNEYSNPMFSLVKVIPEGFWSIPPGPFVKFHIIMPLEGLIIISILWLFYSRLDVAD